MPLLNRHTFPPNGFQFYQPSTNWPKSQAELAGLTFDQVCQRIQAHRAANPRFQLSTDLEVIAAELDEYTCTRLKFDPNYCTGGGAYPKAPRPMLRLPAPGASQGGKDAVAGAEPIGKIRKLTLGIGVLIDLFGSGARSVSQDLANQRAAVCVQCPKNTPGGWETFFTGPAANKIKQFMQLKNEMELKTPLDTQLHVCNACLCHLQTKVWVPISHILKKLQPEMRNELWEKCWIRKEENENQPKPHGDSHST